VGLKNGGGSNTFDENNTLLPVYDYKYMVKKINEAYTS
jgi:hypothetical protein